MRCGETCRWGKDSYVYVTQVGSLVVIKKVDELSSDDISAILEPFAKKSGVTAKMLLDDIERTRAKRLGERQEKIQPHCPH